MGFIERLRQEDTTRAQQLGAQQEAQERERLQKEAYELKVRAQRRMQAEQYHQESGVAAVVGGLVCYLEAPTIPIIIHETRDGWTEMVTQYNGRGAQGLPNSPAFNQRDRDSVLDAVHWDHVTPSGYGTIKSSYKYIVVESCPDGTIVFHGDWIGSTTLKVAEWRTKDKEQLFDRTLEKAFKHSGMHRYSFYRPEPMGFG